MEVEVIHVILLLNHLDVLTCFVVKLDRMEPSDVAEVDFDDELLVVVLLVFWAHDRVKLKPVVRQSELAFDLTQTRAVVYDNT